MLWHEQDCCLPHTPRGFWESFKYKFFEKVLGKWSILLIKFGGKGKCKGKTDKFPVNETWLAIVLRKKL